MKFSNLVMFSAVCAMAASCSNDEPNITPVPEGNDSGYISLSIGMPTVDSPASRADAAYDQGTEDEYAVRNGRIIVFLRGASEADAQCVCVSDLSGMSWSAGAAGEITTSSRAVAHLGNIDMTNNAAQYSAIVVLNYADNFVFPTQGQTFGSWAKAAQTAPMTISADSKTYITMSSAPRFDTPTSDPITLAPIDKSMIAQSESKLTGSAASVYVQRAVAKVAMTIKDSYAVASTNYSGDKVSIVAWGLDVTNKSNFPVQVTDGLRASYSDIWSKARFSGAENSAFRRLFWAIDPNYDKAIDNDAAIRENFSLLTSSRLSSKPAFAYCRENTFDIRHQLQGQTTRVVFKGQYTPAGMTIGTTFFKVGTAIYDQAGLENLIKAKAPANATVALGTVAGKGGKHSVSEVTVTVNGADADAATKDAIAKSLGLTSATDAGISTYLYGHSYYIARVKHFGDSETPWELGDPTYGDDNAKWLGRYGMVRNHIYDINLNSISGPGEPEIPTPDPNEPDDESDFFIQLDMNVLAWAKRTHNVDL